MLLIAGPSGAGKTTVLKYLEELGFDIVDTYSTRPPRPDDAYTTCITQEEFDQMVDNEEFISTATFDAKFGKVHYGIKKVDCTPFNTLVIAKEYYNDIMKQYKDIAYLVYLNVDKETIIETSMKQEDRGLSNTDLLDRLARDAKKNQFMKNHAELIINNRGFHLSPIEIAEQIHIGYLQHIKRLARV